MVSAPRTIGRIRLEPMRFVVLTSILLSLTACKKKEVPTATTSGSGSAIAVASDNQDAGPTNVATPVATGSATAPTGTLNCDRVLSADMRAKYFSDGKITDTTHDKPYEGSCKIEQPDNNFSDIDVQCDDKVYGRMQTAIDGAKKLWKNEHDLPGVGKAATAHDIGKVAAKPDEGTQVQAWDDDSNCYVTLHVPIAIDATAFTKDLLASLPPK